MVGSWRYTDISGDPDAVTPQAHWLNHIMGASPGTWFGMRLSAPLAEKLDKALAGERSGQDEPVDRLARTLAVPAVSREWLKRRSGADLAQVELLVAPDGFAPLEALSKTPDLDLIVAGPAPEGAAGIRSPNPGPNLPAGPVTKFKANKAVIVAVIDDGIAVANERFRLGPDRTRVAWFYDMNAPSENPPANTPALDAAGRAWHHSQINKLMAEHVEEADVYRAMGLIGTRLDRRDPLRFRGTHGTAVLDVASGYAGTPDDVHEAKRRPIVAVQLPSGVAEDRSATLLPTSFDLALDFVGAKARALSAELTGGQKLLPLVVNFSFGIHAGPHDGHGEIARRIEAFIDDYRSQPGSPPCEVVVSAGNSLQQRSAAVMQAPAVGASDSLDWFQMADDRTSSFVQIWLPESDIEAQQVEVSLSPSRGGPAGSAATRLGEALDWIDDDGNVLARLYHRRVRGARSKPRECITIALRPTAEYAPGDIVVPHGDYTVSVKNLALPKGAVISLRVQRDDPEMRSRRRGRQSRWSEASYRRYDKETTRLINDETIGGDHIRRLGTQSEYATGTRSVVVAGYRRSDGEPAFYSSSGPAGLRPGPTLAAVSEESPALPGVLASGTYTGSITAFSGTSQSAPAVTRALAGEIARGGDLQSFLATIEAGPPPPVEGPQKPYAPVRPARMGRGRLIPAPVPGYRQRLWG